MAKAVKKMRLPPKSNEDLAKQWIAEGAKAGNQVPSDPVTQVTENLLTTKPAGPGIVERAAGVYRRRLVVYLEPDRARRLKAAAALDGRDMSNIVDGLVADWLEASEHR